MDDTDLSLFGSKKNSKKHDKADASPYPSGVEESQPPTEGPIKVTSRPADDDTYQDYPNAGVALIFNHKDIKGQKSREGTEKDRDEVVRSMQTCGFDVRVYNDLTFEEISAVLKKTAAEDHSENTCFWLVVMSHGTEGKVYAKDMAYPVERLWNPFLGNNCKGLINKPKLFFIQACRGQNLEKPVVYQSSFVVGASARGFAPMSALGGMPEPKNFAIPSTADMLVMYSTFEKYFSFRNVENGSWFIQCLCQVINEAVEGEAASPPGAELLRLLTAVNRRVAYEYQSMSDKEALNQKKEMPNFMSTLTKTFYLRAKGKYSK